MPSIPGVSQREAERVFAKLGYEVIRQGKHLIMSDGVVTLIIPRHNPINAFTMGALAKQAGLTPEQFREML